MSFTKIDLADFDKLVGSVSTEVSSQAIGGRVLSVSDEWFAPCVSPFHLRSLDRKHSHTLSSFAVGQAFCSRLPFVPSELLSSEGKASRHDLRC